MHLSGQNHQTTEIPPPPRLLGRVLIRWNVKRGMFEIAGDRDALSVAEVSVDIVPQGCRKEQHQPGSRTDSNLARIGIRIRPNFLRQPAAILKLSKAGKLLTEFQA